LLDDRDAPRYQRAQPVTAAERALFDRLLAAAGVRRLAAAADAERLRQAERRRQRARPEARPWMQQRTENDADL
jgi:hypothetical protein